MAESDGPSYLFLALAFTVLGSLMLAIGWFFQPFLLGPPDVLIDITATLRDRATNQPVPGCTLRFEPSSTTAAVVTDASGVARGRVTTTQPRSLLPVGPRRILVTAEFVLGEPPYQRWFIRAPIRTPWFGDTTNADVELTSVSLDGAIAAPATIVIGAENGRTVYRLPIDLPLDVEQRRGGCKS